MKDLDGPSTTDCSHSSGIKAFNLKGFRDTSFTFLSVKQNCSEAVKDFIVFIAYNACKQVKRHQLCHQRYRNGKSHRLIIKAHSIYLLYQVHSSPALQIILRVRIKFIPLRFRVFSDFCQSTRRFQNLRYFSAVDDVLMSSAKLYSEK